jgi:hypothetical protein
MEGTTRITGVAGRARVHPEAARCWRLLSERLASEADERVRANLEVVMRHVEYEYLGDLDAVMATLVGDPQYEYFGTGGLPGPKGYNEVRSMYQAEIDAGKRHLFELTRVVADRGSVVLEGIMHQTHRGADLLDYFGSGREQPIQPEAMYVAECVLLVVIPVNDDGLMEGERVHAGDPLRITGELGPGELPSLGPIERKAGERSQ